MEGEESKTNGQGYPEGPWPGGRCGAEYQGRGCGAERKLGRRLHLGSRLKAEGCECQQVQGLSLGARSQEEAGKWSLETGGQGAEGPGSGLDCPQGFGSSNMMEGGEEHESFAKYWLDEEMYQRKSRNDLN